VAKTDAEATKMAPSVPVTILDPSVGQTIIAASIAGSSQQAANVGYFVVANTLLPKFIRLSKTATATGTVTINGAAPDTGIVASLSGGVTVIQ
jgi:hypothetical protein